MSDERQQNRHNGHIGRGSDKGSEVTEMLPVELEPIHERLLNDSKGWTRRLPEADVLAGYARALATGTATAISVLEPAGGHDGDDASIRAVIPAAYLGESSLSRSGRRGGPGRVLLGLVAAIAVVILMAAVFNSLAPGRSPASGKPTANIQPTSTVIPTATPRPAYGPIRGSWRAVPSLQGQHDLVTVAQSDPKVVYETVYTGSTTTIPSGQDSVLRRSDDGGKTWHDLSVPQPAFANMLNWGPGNPLVSPADPNMIVVGVRSQLSYATATTCPTALQTARAPEHGGILAYGALDCAVQYESKDGGSSWTPITVAGIQALPVNGFDALYAQDGRYYATFDASSDQPAAMGGYRVVSSTDGVHWSPIDAGPLAAANKTRFCGFIAVPTGSTVYAETNDRGCSNYNGPADHLWRSDDIGLHWRDLGPLPYAFTGLMAAEQGAEDAQPTLYLWTATTVGQTASGLTDLTVRVSMDGGYTWQAAPEAGIPSRYQPYMQVTGTLSDGSVVMIYVASTPCCSHDPATVGFYAWHAGESEWHQVAPLLTIADGSNLSGGWNTFFVTPSGGVHGTVWHEQFNPRALTYSVETYSS